MLTTEEEYLDYYDDFLWEIESLGNIRGSITEKTHEYIKGKLVFEEGGRHEVVYSCITDISKGTLEITRIGEGVERKVDKRTKEYKDIKKSVSKYADRYKENTKNLIDSITFTKYDKVVNIYEYNSYEESKTLAQEIFNITNLLVEESKKEEEEEKKERELCKKEKESTRV